jgi:hypothetical protein
VWNSGSKWGNSFFPITTLEKRVERFQMQRREYLRIFHEEFTSMPLSQGIATLPSLVVLDHILTTYEIRKVLEFGRGLGTLTKFMGSNFDVEIYSLETNDYCITKSRENLIGVEYQDFRSIREIPDSVLESIDLVVIDGPISKSDFKLVIRSTRKRIYFFENHQLISKIRIILALFLKGRTCRYIEIFPYHDNQGPSYVISLPRSSVFVLASNFVSLGMQQVPRLVRFVVYKILSRENPFSDSYSVSKWNPSG